MFRKKRWGGSLPSGAATRERPYTYPILLSSRETKQDVVQRLEAGADDCLTKPFDANELRTRLGAGERILELEDRLAEARESMRFPGYA